MGIARWDLAQKTRRHNQGQTQDELDKQFEEVAMNDQRHELQIGTATSAVLVSLLQTLVEKGVLSNSEVRGLLTKAASDLGPHGYTAPYEGSMGFILDDLLPKFPEDGGN